MTRNNLKGKFRNYILVVLAMVSTFHTGLAQHNGQVLDKILAVVGKNRIITYSDLEIEAERAQKQMPNFNDSIKCLLFEQMVMEKLLVEQGVRDSIVIAPEEVESSLDNRIRYFQRQYGSREALEQAAGKSIYQLKDDFRDFTRDEMIKERVKESIVGTVKVTPAEVRSFFEEATADTLPYFPATVEIGQIVVKPDVSPLMDQYAREKLAKIREDIVLNGQNFETMATIYSQDPGTKDDGGNLGLIERSGVVPEFAAAAFKLKEGEISPIVKTKYGYHIIQMVRRQGEAAVLRHILITPEITSEDFQKTLLVLDTIKAKLDSSKISFAEAVGKYSNDEQSKLTGGMVTNPQTGSTQLEIDELDPTLALEIGNMKVGEYSKPQVFVNPQTKEKSTRIVYLYERIDPHQANLKDDYGKIQALALQRKKAQAMEDWVEENAPTFYLKVDAQYQTCPGIKSWMESAQKNRSVFTK